MTKNSRAPRADGDATRARILEAAGRLIAVSGFADTASKAIAAEAGADLASINYHFGSRAGLYQAVLVEAHRRFIDLVDLQQVARTQQPARDKFRTLVEHLVKLEAGPEGWHLSVLSAEILAPSPHIQALLQSEVPTKMAVIMDILSEITGIPVGDPALPRCLISAVSPCLLLQIGRRAAPAPAPIQTILNTPREAVVEHLYRFSIAGLEAIGQDYARARAKPEGGRNG